ncbi:MAG: reverse transcriptase domain-containing protein [Clostridia bacterium]
MPKRASHLYEMAVSDENGLAAVNDMLKGKRSHAAYGRLTTSSHKEIVRIITKRLTIQTKRGNVEHYRTNADRIGCEVAAELREGRWKPMPYRERLIFDGLRRKVRRIKVPCLHDQVVHHAIMRVTAPEIMRRNDWHNCGSIPGAGQSRAVKIVRGWMRRKRPPKYALCTDVRKFYDNCPHASVMAALRRIVKDRQLLCLHEQVLASMGDGLAIGFYPSQWYGNLVLAAVDKVLAATAGVDYARYMDDVIAVSNSKRVLHRLQKAIDAVLRRMGMEIKHTWQVFRIAGRGIAFLSYRFYAGYTVLRKVLMTRIARAVRSAAKNLTPHIAMTVMSYMGILEPCNSYHYRKKYVYAIINLKRVKEVIRYVSHLCRVQRAALTIRGAARGE